MSQRPATLFSEEVIRARVARMAAEISRDYAGVERLHLVGVLKGAFIFLADLSRQLTIRHHVDFVALASYGDSSVSSGEVRLVMDLRHSVARTHVLIVDDIIDSGSTLARLKSLLSAHEPASIRTCVLVSKAKDRRERVNVDYVGFSIPDVWVVGYGLDYADEFRTLPYIGTVEPSDRSG